MGADALDEERAASEAEFRRRLIPPPIDPLRLRDIATQLEFDASQMASFETACKTYAEAHGRARDQRQRKLDILIPAAFRFDSVDRAFKPVYTPELLSALALQDEIGAKILAAEMELDRAIDSLCSPQKRPVWRALRLERAKELFEHPARLPAANVDLLVLVPKCGLKPEEVAVLEPFFEKYSTDLLACLRRRHEALGQLRVDRAKALVDLGPEWRAGRSDQEALDVDRELAKLDVAETLADFELRNANDAGLAAIRRTLGAPSARKVIEAYRRVVHPELYEDERSYRVLVEEMVGLATIDQQSIGGVVQSLSTVEERLRPYGEQAADLADGIIAAGSLASNDAAAARVLLLSKLQSVLEKRRRVVREGVQALRGIVPTTEGAFAARLDDAVHSLAALDRAGRYLRDALDSRASEVALLEAQQAADAEAADAESHDDTPPPDTQMTSPTEPATPSPPPAPRRSRGSRGSS